MKFERTTPPADSQVIRLPDGENILGATIPDLDLFLEEYDYWNDLQQNPTLDPRNQTLLRTVGSTLPAMLKLLVHSGQGVHAIAEGLQPYNTQGVSMWYMQAVSVMPLSRLCREVSLEDSIDPTWKPQDMDVVAGINRNPYFTGLYLSRRALTSVFDIKRPNEGEANDAWFEGPSVYVETVAMKGLRRGLASCTNIIEADIPDAADYTLARAYLKSGELV